MRSGMSALTREADFGVDSTHRKLERERKANLHGAQDIKNVLGLAVVTCIRSYAFEDVAIARDPVACRKRQ